MPWWLLKLINPLKGIAREIARVIIAKQDATTEQARIESDENIAALRARQAVLIAEQASWETRWVRPAFALLAFMFWAKIIVWDTLLGWGVTPDPGPYVMWFVTLIPNVYFLTRPFEKRRK